MEPTTPETDDLSDQSPRTNRIVTLVFLVAVQIAMLVVLNVFDYAYIFPSRSGLTLGHELLFMAIYFVALVWGAVVAFRRFHWAIGAVQIVAPILLFMWLTSPHQYNPAKYQSLVGKTKAEVDAILGRKAANGVGRDENGTYVHYHGMRIIYAVKPGNRGTPDEDDRASVVEADL